MAGRGKLIAVLGDEDTVTGFLLGGVGELDKHRRPRAGQAPAPELPGGGERNGAGRDRGGLSFIAEMIRHVIDAHNKSLPAVLEIPSKEHPYDASKDSILRRARGMFTAEDLR
ncbi:V-type proton ATPase subunit F, partial [Ophiophagus hannah]